MTTSKMIASLSFILAVAMISVEEYIVGCAFIVFAIIYLYWTRSDWTWSWDVV